MVSSRSMAENWSQAEVELIVADYFDMLMDELGGRPINKTEHRRKLLPLLCSRSDASIEMKHQNISALLNELGYPFIKGYKPLPNYQRAVLPPIVLYHIGQHPKITGSFEHFATEKIAVPKDIIRFNDILEDAPEKQKIVLEPTSPYRRVVKINYLEMEERNRQVGMQGEQIALEYEQWRLRSMGKDSLADRVEWVSKDRGDGLGFDILSKNDNGSDRYIEVKSTKLTKQTSIYFTRNEYEFAKENRSNFHLYRIFNLKENPKLFIADGSYDDFCRTEAVTYQGYF